MGEWLLCHQRFPCTASAIQAMVLLAIASITSEDDGDLTRFANRSIESPRCGPSIVSSEHHLFLRVLGMGVQSFHLRL
jgi:hypothetical protein